MIIKSDNALLQAKLLVLKELLIEHGAWFHPNMIINCEGNSMSIEVADPCDAEEIIIKIPDHLLVPLDGLNVFVQEHKFVINPDKDKLSPELIAVAELIFEIYNVSEKVGSYKNESPWITFRQTPKLLTALLRGRSMSEALNIKDFFLRKLPGSLTIEEFIAFDFPRTRVLACKDKDSDEKILKLLPVVDYLNHDYRGGPFLVYGHEEYKDDGGFLKIKNTQPFPSRSECYASYGIYDAVDTFIHYGFISDNTPYLRSIPLEVPLRNMDNLIIHSYVSEHQQPKQSYLSDLKELMPSIGFTKNSKKPVISHLIISTIPMQHSTRHVLQTLIEASAGTSVSPDFVLDKVHEAEKFIIEKNIDFYNKLTKKTDNNKRTPEALRTQIRDIASIQLNILHEYSSSV